MQAREEIVRGLFATSRDATELVDKIEEALDEIAFCVEREIAIALDLAV